jgi:hypothetical protein
MSFADWQNTGLMPSDTRKLHVSEQLRKFDPISHAFWTIPLLIARALLTVKTTEVSLLDCIAWSKSSSGLMLGGSRRNFGH